ncbi:hypothetical protein POM88_004917 [Heracleum sosnowskyi]|uniref:Uncharacterized protein n=1 Tax=Heracleum sosnowskyi TaxID=360622 RepID=A0AAD8JMP2_9APIA|nr:hypothetical protein POM88_004917 [Heracleum sosnowskyi]
MSVKLGEEQSAQVYRELKVVEAFDWVWGAERMQSGGGYQPWEHLYTLPGYHKQTIFSVHWSSEGTIATGAADGAIYLFEENRDGLSLERRGAMHKLLLTKEKAHEKIVNLVPWAPKSQERSQAMHGLLLTKEKAHETDVHSVQQGPKERSEIMNELLLTKEKARETDGNVVQQGPKVIIHQRDDLLKFLLLKDNC